MPEPRLTISIPTLDRARFLTMAIDSALAQTVPAYIVVSDQGHTDEVAQVMRRYKDHPLVRHVLSPAKNLWSNWRFGMEQADTEFVSVLQDDDQLSRSYAARIMDGFDRWPDADLWTARLAVGDEFRRALWFLNSGPWMPMNLLDGAARCDDSDLLMPTSYFTVFAMSPAVAFRRGERFMRALERVPSNCDLYNERFILAAMAAGGRFISDPMLAGYWVQHSGNESRNQHPDQPRQTEIAIEWFDNLMDEIDSEKALKDMDLWAAMMPVSHLYAWAECLASQRGRWEKRIGEIIVKHLKEGLPRFLPKGMTPVFGMDGTAPEYAYSEPSPHEVLVFND